jgi:translation initiation factor 5A
MREEHDFESGSAGAAESIPAQASSLRKNGHVLIKGHPCKIVEMSSSKTGKHGHAKIHFVALDIFDNKKYEDICPSTHNMQVPNVKRKEMFATGIDEDHYVTIQDLSNPDDEIFIKADNPDQAAEINKMIEEDGQCIVNVLSSMGQEKIHAVARDQPGK